MIITKIEKVKRKNRYEVYADGGLVGTMSADMILTYRLSQGKEIAAEDLVAMMEKSACSDAWTTLLTCLSSKAYTVKMARDKLKDQGFEDKAVEYALDKAIGYNYINDEEYAKELLMELCSKRSTRRIKQDMYQRGLSGAYVEELLSLNDESEACKYSLERKLHGKLLDKENELKVMNYLAGQGFGYDTIRETVSAYKEGCDE